jgi:SAM-dependent methyltransferase
MSREKDILSMLEPSGRGLEIGAGYNPMFPKRKGFRVETVDHASAEELVRKFREMGIDASRVEEVDYVWRGEPLHELVPHHGAYDFIFASHVVEHMPDMVGFINSCDRLLNDRGIVLLAVPDKRYCFDALRPIASAGDVIQAHLEGRKRHPPGKVFDHTAYYAFRRGRNDWRRRTFGRIAPRSEAIEEARKELERAMAAGEYIDVHGWQFVPSSFRLILKDLHLIHLTPMKEVAFLDARGERNEFYISFARWGRGCPLDRTTLCRRILYEQRAGVDGLGNSLWALVTSRLAAAARSAGSLLGRGGDRVGS